MTMTHNGIVVLKSINADKTSPRKNMTLLSRDNILASYVVSFGNNVWPTVHELNTDNQNRLVGDGSI